MKPPPLLLRRRLVPALTASTQVAGLAAGLTSPAVSVVGLVLWDANWTGSAFALNLYKCSLASIMFLVTVLALPSEAARVVARLDVPTAAALAVSSTLGIVIGDNTWLASMRILGARRVILVDSLKPFLAAGMAGTVLRERSSPLALLAMAVGIAGVVTVSLERVAPNAHSDRPASVDAQLLGYALAVVNVVFDVLGSVLTKRYGGGLGPWAIGLLRFGFAACAMWVMVAGRALLALLGRLLCREGDRPVRPAHGMTELMPAVPEVEDTLAEGAPAAPELKETAGDGAATGAVAEAAPASSPKSAGGSELASRAPLMPALSARAWALVSCGVVLVTYLSVALGNVALFALPLSLCLTLSSLGPVYAIPLSYLIKREVVSWRAALGSMLAVIGVGAFCQLG